MAITTEGFGRIILFLLLLLLGRLKGVSISLEVGIGVGRTAGGWIGWGCR